MDHFTAQRQRLRSMFGVFFAPEVIAALLALVRPAVRLGPDGETAVRFGGTPLLPAGAPWPTWNGRPLDYLCTVDFTRLAAMVTLPGLPTEGRVAFYYASATPRPWGDEPDQRDGWRLFSGDLKETEPPEGAVTYPPCTLHAAPLLSLPAPQEPVLRQLENTYSGTLPVYEQLYAAWMQHIWPDDTPVHQIGGWPALVQRPLGSGCRRAFGQDLDPPGSEDGAHGCNLLLQLDSDPRLDWYWGDPGRVYFCTHQGQPLYHAWLTLQAT
ncbi:YwqG family protein [Actinomadura keratinilytica]|jgi:hypothetical protein|uniref:DUF1963 domain-containing protein n=1 Tax=Actinomadura keratinilytica TaxID=547461 RepID=A0ABP7YN71_9ACTN